MQGDQATAPESGPARRLDPTRLGDAYNEFLQLSTADLERVRRAGAALEQESDEFVEDLYRYLLGFPETASILKRFTEMRGQTVAQLVHTQHAHLRALLSGDIGGPAAARLLHLGEIHYRWGIEPPWMLATYLKYLQFLTTRVAALPEDDVSDRAGLVQAIERLLFRDIGLMLQGYWEASSADTRAAQASAEQLRERVTSLLSNVPLILWSVTPTGELLYVSPHGQKHLADRMRVPLPWSPRVLPQYREAVALLWQRALQGESGALEAEVLDVAGPVRWIRYTLYPFPVAALPVERVDGVLEDVTEAKEFDGRLKAVAGTDQRTGLPNQTLLLDRLGQAIHSARRSAGTQIVLILVELRDFRSIVDALGPSAGDEVVSTAADRLLSVLRDSDTLARMGDDAFGILIPDAKDARVAAERVLAKVSGCFRKLFALKTGDLYVKSAIGVAMWPADAESSDDLLSRARAALDTCRVEGLDLQFYEPQARTNSKFRLELTTELREQLKRCDELVLYYQPIIELPTKRPVCAEALIRWEHPQLGLLLPNQFLPLAERAGVIGQLTEWVIQTALEQCQAWRSRGILIRVASNISSRLLYDRALVDQVCTMLRDFGTVPDLLELEVTEESLIADPQEVSNALRRLAALGAAIAIDDFGTGYSSLAYLTSLPVHALKVDRRFVSLLPHDESACVIVRSTINMAHDLGLRVVAEGVETPEQYAALVRYKCNRAQGYGIGMPMPAPLLEEWLRSR